MSAQMNVPKLRFPEFSGEWEEKKLREVADINPSNKTLPESFIYIDLESVENGELRKENTVYKSEAPSRAQRLLKINDVLFQTVRPYQMNNLYFDRIGDYVASTGYAQLRTKQNSMFVFQYLHFQKFVDKVIERCTGTSYPSINSTDLSNIIISIPTLPEQTKIATFLTTIDTKIDQLTKKQTLLNQYKKGVMQKLFSQELRFKADDGSEYSDWEEKTLGEIATFTKGKGISKADIAQDGSIECVTYGELYTTYSEAIRDIKSKTNLEVNQLVLSEYNDVLIPASGETQIDIATASCILKSNVALGGDLNIIKSKMNGVFLSYYLNNNKKNDIAKLAQGVSVVHLYATQLKTLQLTLPSLDEQIKIANFLLSIDAKINLVIKQFDATKQFKKALLQQMFV